MKKKLLIVCALVLTSVCTRAQWPAPELPLTTDHIPSSALFYHVGQEMFITAGTTWGTRVSLTPDVAEAFLYEIQDQGDNVYQFYCASAKQTGYMGRETTVNIYTDTKTGNWSAWGVNWTFEKMGDYYRILTASTDPVFGYGGTGNLDPETIDYSLYQMGWDPNNMDLDQYDAELGTNLGIFMLDPAATDLGYELDWAFVDGDDYNLYVARYSLYSTLTKATETGLAESDLSSYGALLTSTDVDAINDATATVEQLILDFSFDDASPENPRDVTSVITNPTFEGSAGYEPEGWINTYDNVLIQDNKEYELWDEEAGELTNEYGFINFAQNWRAETDVPIEASDIHQVIADLPQGRYYVIADCIATTGSATNPVSGASLYAISNGVTYAQPVCEGYTTDTEGTGYPRRYSVNVIHFGGDLTIGYGYEPGWVRWFAVDNFQLYYCGAVDGAGLLGLTAAIQNAQEYVDEYDYSYIYSEATYLALVAELENANDIAFGGDDDACQAEIVVVNGMIDAVKAEVTAYANLLAFCDQLLSDMATYEYLEELSNMISDMRRQYNDAYEDRKATVEDIEGWISAYDTFISDYVWSIIDTATEENPLEITALATNMSYASNGDDGWTVTTGSAGNNGSFAVDFHTAEVWSNTFACLQTLENMPAGAYKLQAKAFYRTSSNEATYDDYISGTGEILTYLVVEDSKGPVVNQAAGAQVAEVAPYTGYSETYEGSGIWVPNTMQSAEYAFNADDTYLCEVDGYLREDGTLTFGIRNDDLTDGNAWSIWTQFRLFYSGPSTSQLYASLMELVAEAASLDDQIGGLVEEADNRLINAIAATDDLSEDSSEADLLEAYKNLEEAIAYGNESIALISSLREAADIYEDKFALIESSDPAFPALMEEIEDAIGNEEFVSNEKMNEWIDALPAAWTAFVQYDCLETATVEEPADITAVLTNPSFDYGTNNNNGATGWTISYEGSGHVGIANTSQQEASDYAFEFWKVSSCDIHQTIPGLAEGYYHLTVQGLFRAGSSNSNDVLASYMESEDGDRFVMFYGNTAGVLMCNVYDYAQTEETGADGEVSATYDGVTYYTPNTMASAYEYFQLGYYLNEFDVYVAEGDDLTIGLLLLNSDDSNWCLWDNFTIAYMGTEAPTAVEGIEADETDAIGADGIYDLTGRRVAKAQKGIYIINGKKVVIK